MERNMFVFAQIGAVRALKQIKLISSETEDLISNNITNRRPLIYNINEDRVFLLDGLKAISYVDENDKKTFCLDIVLDNETKEIHSELERFVIGEPFNHGDILQTLEVYTSVINTLAKV